MTNSDNIVVKKCANCQETKELDFFWKRARAKDGYTASCIECVRIQNQKSYKNFWSKNRTRIDANNYLITERLRERCNQIKHKDGCYFCRENDPICLDFHHKNSNEKEMDISAMICRHRKWEAIEKEISKCVVLCSNCHRKTHAGVLSIKC